MDRDDQNHSQRFWWASDAAVCVRDKKGRGGDNDLENKYRISKLDMDREVVETWKKKKKKAS